jgi:hypothetical protein
MKRIEEVKKLVDNYFKSKFIFYRVETSEDWLLYTIDNGMFPLRIQFEFFDELDELKYPEEYCMIAVWIPLSDYDNIELTYDTSTLDSLEAIIPEVETGLDFYAEKLQVIIEVEKSLNNIKLILERNGIEYDDSIDFKTFMYGN